MVRSSAPKGSASATVGEGEADGDIEGATEGVQAQREPREKMARQSDAKRSFFIVDTPFKDNDKRCKRRDADTVLYK